MTVGIITSAAYVNAEMAAEFGPLPPAFLPAGNTRLFKYQAELLRRLADRVVLTLPESFEIPRFDARLLTELGVAVLRIPDGLSLAQSVMLAVIRAMEGDEPAVILHGDTLFLDLEAMAPECLSAHAEDHPYPWAVVAGRDPVAVAPIGDADEPGAAIVSGLFSFAHGLSLVKCLAAADTDFLAAINAYARMHPGFGVADGAGEWLDFGHLNTYYRSRRRLTTERRFNALAIAGGTVVKSSAQREKMEAEASWYEALPAALRPYVPAYLGRTQTASGCAGYRLVYEHLCPLSDLFVFGALGPAAWRRILTRCAETLALLKAAKPAMIEPDRHAGLYAVKTLSRFAQFARNADIDPDQGWRINGSAVPSPRAVIAEMAALIGPAVPDDFGILHGDFCLSNILFDFRRDSVKLIDPRGYVRAGEPELHGDTRYDTGKLHHSIIGGYDFIVAGRYALERTGPAALSLDLATVANRDEVERHFRDIVCEGSTERMRTAAAISVLLFFAMLPLHGEAPERQWALFANGYRLYQELVAA